MTKNNYEVITNFTHPVETVFDFQIILKNKWECKTQLDSNGTRVYFWYLKSPDTSDFSMARNNLTIHLLDIVLEQWVKKTKSIKNSK